MDSLQPEIMLNQALINIGTIGHVAHGKSTFVKALSGVHTVRFKKELEIIISSFFPQYQSALVYPPYTIAVGFLLVFGSANLLPSYEGPPWRYLLHRTPA